MDLPAEVALPDPPEAAPEPAPEPVAGWRPVFAPLALLAGFGMAIFGGAIVGLLGALAGASVTHPPASVELLATLLQDVLLVASAVWFAARAGRPRPGDFGLRATAVVRALVLMVGAYVGFLVFAAVWEAILNLNDKEQVVQKLGANSGAVGLVAVVALTCVVAPICEEFFFRGFFFPALSNWRGPWTAAVLTGVVFGAIHVGSAPVGDLVPLAFFGFALCLLRWWSGSLYPCIAVHAVNNCVAFGVSEHWHGEIGLLLLASAVGIVAALSTVARVAPAQ
jgi:uncharacterized protein